MNDDVVMIDQEEIDAIQEKHNITPLKPVDIDSIKLTTLEEMLNETPPPIEYIFHPCMPKQGIGFIYASTGVGKTLFTLNLCYAIATGGEFLKYKCPQPRKVLYVDGEMQYNQLHARMKNIIDVNGEMDFPENLQFITPDKILPLRVPKIDAEEGQYIYREIMMQKDFDVLVLDNLSMLSSFDENKSHEWLPVQDWLLHLRSLGKSIIVIHHSGKMKEGYRGTSRMLDCADVAISLQPVNEDADEDAFTRAKKFKVVYQKARLFGGKDALPFEVILNSNIWSYQSTEISQMDKVLACLEAKMSQRDIAKELLISQTTVNRLIKKAARMGRLSE